MSLFVSPVRNIIDLFLVCAVTYFGPVDEKLNGEEDSVSFNKHESGFIEIFRLFLDPLCICLPIWHWKRIVNCYFLAHINGVKGAQTDPGLTDIDDKTTKCCGRTSGI
jgi:hypothetical protein